MNYKQFNSEWILYFCEFRYIDDDGQRELVKIKYGEKYKSMLFGAVKVLILILYDLKNFLFFIYSRLIR